MGLVNDVFNVIIPSVEIWLWGKLQHENSFYFHIQMLILPLSFIESITLAEIYRKNRMSKCFSTPQV